jgi:hypothetical protein
VPIWIVTYADRIYGYRKLFVNTDTPEDAIMLVERHLGYSPLLIEAGPEIILEILKDSSKDI